MYIDLSDDVNDRICLNAERASSADVADKLSSGTVGNANSPVWFSNGTPQPCENNLNVNISGNAATATKVNYLTDNGIINTSGILDWQGGGDDIGIYNISTTEDANPHLMYATGSVGYIDISSGSIKMHTPARYSNTGGIAIYGDGSSDNSLHFITINPNSGINISYRPGNGQQLYTSTLIGNSFSGNSATATKAARLTTARTINGTSFNGTSNITTANWGTARNISISDSDATNTGTAVSVNGSAAATLKLPATIKATLSGNASSATKIYTTSTNPSTITAYTIPFMASTSSGNQSLLMNDSIGFRTREGTQSSFGVAELRLGNSIAVGTGGNKMGAITMYGIGNNSTTLAMSRDSIDSDISLYLPAESGTLALTSDTVDAATKLATARTINGMSFNGTAAVNNYGVCSTAAATAAKTVTVGSTFSLVTGAQVTVKFTNENSVASPTLNVNSTGAKPIYRYGTTAASTSASTSGWRAGAVIHLTYDGTGWVRDFWENTTYYTPVVTCTTAAGTAAKVGSTSYYTLANNRHIYVMIANSNTYAGAITLNISSAGAKPIYINGSASSASNYTLPRGMYFVYYDGTNYYFRTDGYITGSLSGTATNANYVYCSATTSNATYYLTGVSGTGAGNKRPYIAYNSSASTNTAGIRFNASTGVLYGAAWNDYAEYREQKEEVEPGYCVASNNDGTVYKTTEMYQACDGVVSDTFGFAIGETEGKTTPLAVAGRVLAYCAGNRYDYNAGDTVCAGPGGLVYKMSREEIKEYPDRIIGIVSEIPEYKIWGTGEIEVNERIWIKVK